MKMQVFIVLILEILIFDTLKLEYINDDAANRLLDQPERSSWKI